MSDAWMREKQAPWWHGVLALALTPFTMWLGGWVLVKLWAWFMVPGFGLAPISVPLAIGLHIVVGYLSYQWSEDASKSKMGPLLRLAVIVAARLLALGFGWLVHLFM